MSGFIIFGLLLSLLTETKLEHLTVATDTPHNKKLEFVLRLPAGFNSANAGKFEIMVLFGGRNWSGERTLKCYGFNQLADKYNLLLISPSFKDDNYWEPEKWSGPALTAILDKIRRKYNIPKKKIFYYGYSAGGQCANLFFHWNPKIVKAWGAHACGVWYKVKTSKTNSAHLKKNDRIFALVTCGENDAQRLLLSLDYVRHAREKGNEIIFRSYPGGHELNHTVLALARAFFESVLTGTKIKYIGDDQIMRYYPSNSKRAGRIDLEYRNPFLDLQTAELWRKSNEEK
jgi:hypothetical protein